MSYSKYTHDIFLSYCHLDNRRLEGEKSGWVSRLHNDLDVRVPALLGSAIQIWRDERLQGNEVFSESILDAVANVAAFVAVVTPGYEKSGWCRNELAAFIEAAKNEGGIQLGTRLRLFKVIKTPLPLEDQPASLRSLLGYSFFDEQKK